MKLTEGEPLPTPIVPTSANLPESLPAAEPSAHEQPEATSEIATLPEQVEALAQEIQRLWSHINSMNLPVAQVPTATDTTFFTREILKPQSATGSNAARA